MPAVTNLLIVLLILTNLWLVSSSRLVACIHAITIQAMILGLLPVLRYWPAWDTRLILISLASVLIKGWALPWLLRRSATRAGARRELSPIVGYGFSMIIALGLLGLCFVISDPLKMPGQKVPDLVIPAAMFTLCCGMFLIIARKSAVAQVLGFLAMENGIYAFGMAFALREPLLVEMGSILDVFAVVFVMGITIHHISREFDHIETDRLSLLKD